MPLIQHQDKQTGLRWYTFSEAPPDLDHAILTRLGGKSEAHNASLNFGNKVGDDPLSVQRNLEIIAKHFHLNLQRIHSPAQVHGVNIGQIMTDTRQPVIPDTDALITDVPNVTLKLVFADCVPVLFYDHAHHAIALSHAGWRGVAGRIVPTTIEAMAQAFGTKANQLWVGIGPAIGPDHYIVGQDVADKVQSSAPLARGIVKEDTQGNIHLNLEGAVAAQLQEMGVEDISEAGVCTACHTDEWYSHRAEKGKTGRFGVFVKLR